MKDWGQTPHLIWLGRRDNDTFLRPPLFTSSHTPSNHCLLQSYFHLLNIHNSAQLLGNVFIQSTTSNKPHKTLLYDGWQTRCVLSWSSQPIHQSIKSKHTWQRTTKLPTWDYFTIRVFGVENTLTNWYQGHRVIYMVIISPPSPPSYPDPSLDTKLSHKEGSTEFVISAQSTNSVGNRVHAKTM